MLGTVSLDYTFYRTLDARAYARLAAQVPPGFRFVVKAPSATTVSHIQEPGTGKCIWLNAAIFAPALAPEAAVRPAVSAFGAGFGVLVFQLSPLPRDLPADVPSLTARLERVWQEVLPTMSKGALVSLDVRD